MRRLQIKFPSQIRISGWDFGSSARAMNQAGGKDSLMTYESVPFTQAELRTVRRSTTERKKMSTKTSIKRIALVAVSALGFGMVTGVAANAANNAQAVVNSISLAQVTATPTTGSAVAVNFEADVDTQTNLANAADFDAKFIGYLSSYPASGFAQVTANASDPSTDTELWTSVAGNNAGASVTEGVSGAAYTATVTSGADTDDFTGNTAVASATVGAAQFSFIPTVAGTYVLTVFNDAGTPDGAINIGEAVQTISLTVVAPTAPVFSPAYTVSRYDDTDNDGVTAADELAAVTAFSKSVGDAAAVQIDLNSTTNAAWATTGVSISATVTGSGLLNVSTADTVDAAKTAVNATLRTASIADATGTVAVVIGSDGTAGTGVYTISATAGSTTTVLKTVTITWFGDVSSVTATQRLTVAASGGATLGAQTSTGYAVKVTVADAAGNGIQGVTPTATSSNTLVIASGSCTATTSAGVSYCTTTSAATAKSGETATLTYSVNNAAGTAVKSAEQTFKIGGADYTASLTLSSTSVAPGELVTITITALDSSGNTATDGEVFAASAITSNMASQGLPNTAAISTVNGSATLDVYAPAVSGTWTISATDASGVVRTASATVTGSSDAALDAANEATDAANAATDAANAAAEAADAATAAAQDAQAAVAALATQVASLIAGIKAQITTLTNLVIKIQKKVKA